MIQATRASAESRSLLCFRIRKLGKWLLPEAPGPEAVKKLVEQSTRSFMLQPPARTTYSTYLHVLKHSKTC